LWLIGDKEQLIGDLLILLIRIFSLVLPKKAITKRIVSYFNFSNIRYEVKDFKPIAGSI